MRDPLHGAVARAELAGASGFGRLLRNLLAHVPASEVVDVVADALPWTRFLSEEGRAELGSTLDACAELETFVALGQLLAEWKGARERGPRREQRRGG